MGHKTDTTAGNGSTYQVTRGKPHKRSKARVYADATYNPVAGIEIEIPTGHRQARRTNTNNNKRNGGTAMRYNWSEGLAGGLT
jgi:hypothetical protein